jgi:hypothetical protein
VPIPKLVNKNFFKIWTPEMAYVLGFFAADGYITNSRRGGWFWCIQIADKALLEQIRKVIGSEHKIGSRVHKKYGTLAYRLQIGSVEMCNDLIKLGFGPNKTKSMAIPAVPDEFLPDFVRGYFDGDGNVWSGLVHKDRKTPTVVISTTFTSCSKEFLECLRKRLEDWGIGPGSLRQNKRNYCRLVYSVHSSLKLYAFMYNHVVPEDLFLKRKEKVFKSYIKLRL